jgi:hypothetical protein
MKRVAIYAILGVLLSGTPAFAKGGLSINAGLGISTGKGGLVTSLLGGKTNVGAAVNVSTGKGGILGALIGGKSGPGGHGRGGCGCR